MKKWSEEEKQAFYDLLKDNYLNTAIRLHAASWQRSERAVRGWIDQHRRMGTLPKEVLDSIKHEKQYWTKGETDALLKLVKEYPNNFSEAFRIHAQNTGRPTSAIWQYFSRYRKQEGTKVCMMVIGERKRLSPNRKNIHSGTGGHIEQTKVSKFKRILSILFNK